MTTTQTDTIVGKVLPLLDAELALIAKTDWTIKAEILDNRDIEVKFILAGHPDGSQEIVFGDGYCLSIRHKEKTCKLFYYERLTLADPPLMDWAACGSTIMTSLFRDQESLDRLQNLELARQWVQSFITPVEPDSQTEVRFYYKYLESACATNIAPIYGGYVHFMDLVKVHGWEALGVPLTEAQTNFLNATKDKAAAKDYCLSHARFARVDDNRVPKLLIGNCGCPDHELHFWGANLKLWKQTPLANSQTISSLLEIFPDLLDEISGETPFTFSTVTRGVFRSQVEFSSRGLIHFQERGQDPVGIDPNNVIMIDHLGDGHIQEFLRDFNGKTLPCPSSSCYPIAVVVPRGNKLGTVGGLGIVNGIQHQGYFLVEKGESANFLVFYHFDKTEPYVGVYGLTISRQSKTKFTVSEFQPPREVVALNAYYEPYLMEKISPTFEVAKPCSE